ncbi:MAG TPA: FixH family protein, partial [Verrucomicrobiae bacterium]|nr:FixH family protein [Verrucomicrobiae bacterium]
GARQPSGSIQIYRPSDAALDRQVEFAPDTTGAQRIDAREMVSGLWKLKITWQVGGEEFFVDRVVVISPASS